MENVKTTVVVSRKWNNPEIQVNICDTKIGIVMSIEDFIKALAQECGNPATLMTVKGLEKRLTLASFEVVREMKKKTETVV